MPTSYSGAELAITSGGASQAYGSVTILSDNSLLVAWSEGHSLYARRYAESGTPQGDAFLVYTGASFNGDYSVIAGAGATFIVALRAVNDAWLARVDTANAVTTAMLNTTREAEQWNPEVVRLADGRLAATWYTDAGPFMRLFDSSGVPLGNDAPIAVPTGTSALISTTTAMPDGGLAVAYRLRPSNPSDLAYNWDVGLQIFSGSALTPGAMIRVNTQTAGDQQDAQVVLLADGRIAVIWTDSNPGQPGGAISDTDQSSVRGRLFDATGTALTGEFQINTNVIGSQYQPQVAGLADGGFYVVWTDDGKVVTDNANFPDFDVHGQRFDALGNPLGGEFRINQATPGYQSPTDLALMSDGRLVAVFNDYNSRGDFDYDVHLQVLISAVDPLEGVLSGTGGDDVLTGADLIHNRLSGEGGNDFLRGLGGMDRLLGGEGDDKLEGGSENDALDGGAGFDVASYGNGRAFIDGVSGLRASLANPDRNSGDARGDAFVGIEGLSGSWFGDDLIGDGNANGLWGAQGIDTLWGQGGDDALYGNEDNDWLIGGLGADKLDGGEGFDTARYSYAAIGLRADLKDWWTNSGDAQGDSYYGIEALLGSAMPDLLLGDGSANRIDGAEGNDWLWGREGNDTLVGGSGRDRFCFDTGWGADTITDFNRAELDVLDFLGVAGLTSFSQLLLNSGAGGLTVSFGENSVFLQGVASITAADCVFG